MLDAKEEMEEILENRLAGVLDWIWSLLNLVAFPAVADWMAREVVNISPSFTGFNILLCFVFIIFVLNSN